MREGDGRCIFRIVSTPKEKGCRRSRSSSVLVSVLLLSVAWWCWWRHKKYQQRRHSKTEMWQNQKSKKSKNQARRASSMEFPCFHRDERRKGRKQFFKFRSILVAVRFLSENAELRTGEEEEKKKEGGGCHYTNTTSCVTTLIVHMRGHSHTGVISYRKIACC